MRSSFSRSSSSLKSQGSKKSVFGKLFGKKDELKKAFKKIANKSGTVDVEGLRQAIVSTGAEPPSFDELPKLLAAHDADADGRITLDEFRALIDELDGGGGSTRNSASLSTGSIDIALAPTTASEKKEEAPAAEARGSLVGDRARKFTGSGQSEGGAAGKGGGTNNALAEKMKALQRQGVTDVEPSSASADKPLTQHRTAMAALERKAEKANATKTSASQHAMAMRGLQQAEEASKVKTFKPAERFERSGQGLNALPSNSPGGVKDTEHFSVSGAKQAFAAKAQEAEHGKGSQMEEALRRLHGKGVVPTKMAFGTASKSGTQHADAMKAFQSQGGGVDVSTGFMKKSHGAPKPSAPKANTGGGPTQRQLAMQALQGNIEQAKDSQGQ